MSAKRFQTELEAVRRKFRLDQQALSNMQVCLRDGLSRGGDTAQPFGSDQVVCSGKATLVAGAVTMARMMIKLAHDLSKEREDEFLKSLSRQQSLNEHTWTLIGFHPVSGQRSSPTEN